MGADLPEPWRGLIATMYRHDGAWWLALHPVPRTMSEALRPAWTACFQLTETDLGEEYDLGQFLSAFSGVLEDVAAERILPVELMR